MEIEGNGRGSKLFAQDNYLYKKSSRAINVVYLHCIVHGCHSRATKNILTGLFRITRPHNHLADNSEDRLQIISSCKRRAAGESLPLRQIFDEECRR